MITSKIYPSGLRFVHEYVPTSKLTGVSVTVMVGSANEIKENAGISHFLEHMNCSSTTSKTCAQIETEKDENGIPSNAYTDSERTQYHNKCLNEKFTIALGFLADSFFNAALNEEEIEKERGVILSEFKGRFDSRSIRLFEAAKSRFYGGARAGEPVIGTEENIKKFTREDLLAFKTEHYIAAKTIISIAGGVDFKTAEAAVLAEFADKFTTKGQPILLPQEYYNPLKKSIYLDIVDDVQQDKALIVFPGLKRSDRADLALNLFDYIFASSLSSRLVQEVRVKQGLVYGIYTGYIAASDSGMYYIAYDTPPEKQEHALKAIKKELDKVLAKGITQKELEKVKVMMSMFIVSKELNILSTAEKNAGQMLILDKLCSYQEKTELYKAVTANEVNDVARRIFSSPNILFATLSKSPFRDALKILQNN